MHPGQHLPRAIVQKYTKTSNLRTYNHNVVNARGIPTAAYQVLHLLSYPGGGGVLPHPWPGATPIMGSWSTPHPDLAGGTPSLARGVPPSWPGWGTPRLDLDVKSRFYMVISPSKNGTSHITCVRYTHSFTSAKLNMCFIIFRIPYYVQLQ